MTASKSSIDQDHDFRLVVDDGMGLLVPCSEQAKVLLNDGAFGDVVRFGKGIAVDRRYVLDLIVNLQEDGYTIWKTHKEDGGWQQV